MKRKLLLIIAMIIAHGTIAQSITQAEYFFDLDNGFGNGNSIVITANNGTLAQQMNIPTTGLSTGLHWLYIRVFNDTDKWSLYDSKLIYILKTQNASLSIVAAEYYFNTDPGAGNGEALTVDANMGLLAQAFVLPTTGLPEGPHIFFIRVQDENGTWSLSDNETITISGAVVEDDDGDGVPNSLDSCPQTPENTVVDVNGCEVFSLPATNFSVLSTAESCINSENGSITIDAQENLNYTATLIGDTGTSSNVFSSNTVFENLVAGYYQLCITVEGQTGYESCQEIVITEPEALSVSSKINSADSSITLNLKGGRNYTISLNDKVYSTSDKEITIPLSEVENKLSVRADADCQGLYQETIMLGLKTLAYPNPIGDEMLTVYLGNFGSKTVNLTLYTLAGKEVLKKKHDVMDHKIRVNMAGLSYGMYLLHIRANNTAFNYKIIRR